MSTIKQIQKHVSRRVTPFTKKAYAIDFDGCHAIYIVMDEGAMIPSSDEQQNETEESPKNITYVIGKGEGQISVKKANRLISIWFTNACALRLVNAVESPRYDNSSYTMVIPQFDEELEKLFEELED